MKKAKKEKEAKGVPLFENSTTIKIQKDGKEVTAHTVPAQVAIGVMTGRSELARLAIHSFMKEEIKPTKEGSAAMVEQIAVLIDDNRELGDKLAVCQARLEEIENRSRGLKNLLRQAADEATVLLSKTVENPEP